MFGGVYMDLTTKEILDRIEASDNPIATAYELGCSLQYNSTVDDSIYFDIVLPIGINAIEVKGKIDF